MGQDGKLFHRKPKKELSFWLGIVNFEILLLEKVAQKIAGVAEKPMFLESSLKAVGCLEPPHTAAARSEYQADSLDKNSTFEMGGKNYL